MRLQTIALALILACGATATLEAKPKTHKVKRTYKAQKYKPRKYNKRHA